MKINNQVLFLIFSFAIINLSCKKSTDSNSDLPLEIKTLSNLNGKWEFVNLNLVGYGDFTTCDDMSKNQYTVGKPYLMSFNINSTLGTCTLTDKCIDPIGKTRYIAQTYLQPNLFSFGIYDDQTHSLIKYMFSLVSYENPILKLSFGFTDIVGTNGQLFYLTLKKVTK